MRFYRDSVTHILIPLLCGDNRCEHLQSMTEVPTIKQNAKGIYYLEGEQLWDSDILPVCLEHIKEGDTVIDAGAWIGGHTMAYAKKVGALGRVFAFEPNQSAFDCLVRNKQQFPNVHCLNVALGDKIQPVWITIKKGWYDSGYVGLDDGILVGMFPIDHYDIAPNFIKIDVEGCELKVLKGAAKTIEKYSPKMVIEINNPALERQGDDYSQVLSWLLNHGYVMHPIEKDVTTDTEIYNILAFPV